MISIAYWVLIVGGTVYIDGSAGMATRFPTLESCQLQGEKSLSYEAGKRHVPESLLDLPMQCLHVDAEKTVPRRWGGPKQGWQ